MGPLKNAGRSSPQRPSKAIQGNSARACAVIARDRLHGRADVEGGSASVVAPDALLGRAAEVERLAVEVRVRSGRRVNDRVRAVDPLELVIAPRRPLRALVLAVAHLDRWALQRLGRRRGVEDELDHLPVAFMQVVPVVEDVEEPVLQRELPRAFGFGRDMRVHGRRLPDDEPAFPVQVVAAWLECAAREVEVVLEEPLREVFRARPDLDQVAGAPGPAQRHRGLAEEQVYVDRQVRLARGAISVSDEPHDR